METIFGPAGDVGRRLATDSQRYRGRAGRLFEAGAYWPRLARQLRRFGITRVGDLTGLDHIGVPVVQACRPLAQSNAVSQGKGLTLQAAAVGGCLEAVETWAGERLPAKLFFRARADAGPARLFADLLPARFFSADTICRLDQTDDWLWGWDIIQEYPLPVPAALVTTDFVLGSPYRDAPWLRSTTGLGAGASLLEALIQGLCECIERAALSKAMMEHGFFEHNRVAIGSLAGGPAAALVARLHSDHFRTGLWRVVSPTGLPVFWAQILEREHDQQLLPYPASGYGCRPDAESAAVAAILEAIQGRLAVISGAREDLPRPLYGRFPDRELLAAEWHRLDPAQGTIDFRDIPSTATPDDGTGYDVLLAALRRAGMASAVAVPLFDAPDLPVTVCRAVVPQWSAMAY